jgi:hypothetical protein
MVYLPRRRTREDVVKRSIATLVFFGLLAGLLVAPSSALAPPMPAPADGQKIALEVWAPATYEYPVGSGTWYIDGHVGNTLGPPYGTVYLTSINVVDPRVTVEYLNASDVVVGTETFAAEANVLQASDVDYSTSYRTFHHVQRPPAGSDPTRTRLATEVAVGDSAFPKYHYAVADRSATYGAIYSATATIDDTTLGGGRIQFQQQLTNNTARIVGPIRLQGGEAYGPSPADTNVLDSFAAAPNDAAAALLLGPSESTTFTVRGLRATPAANNRYYPWGFWAEAELPDLIGTVTWASHPISGATVTFPGYFTPTTTIVNGQYAKVGIAGGGSPAVVTYSKPGYNSLTVPITLSGGATVTRDVALTVTPSLTRSPAPTTKTYKRKHGKATYTLSVTVKGTGATPIANVRVRLQRSLNGKTKWKTLLTRPSNAAGKVSQAFVSKKRSTRYYRWVVIAQSGVIGTPKTKAQKIRVR